MIHGLVNEWGSIVTSVADGTQPSTTYGTSITPGTSNAYGSYTSVLSALTYDAYAIEINVNNAYTDSVNRGMLVTIGFDPAGGTSFGGLGGVTGNEISHLLCSGAYAWYSNGIPSGGHRFYFPVFVKAGTSIGAKAQTNEGTARTVRVAVNAYCQPSRPDAIRAGSFVRTYGATTATTDGTTVTPGSASEGSWTSIGTTADRIWYLETGIGGRSATQNDSVSHLDVSAGDGSNKRTLLRDIYFLTGATNDWTQKLGCHSTYASIASGDSLYARAQYNGLGAPQGFSVAFYGVGG
jgi:hypothetical protein